MRELEKLLRVGVINDYNKNQLYIANYVFEISNHLKHAVNKMYKLISDEDYYPDDMHVIWDNFEYGDWLGAYHLLDRIYEGVNIDFDE
jgi:hypothetical protein